MPTTLAEHTTKELIGLLQDMNSHEFTVVGIANELQSRVVPDTDENVEMRGGTRPTHIPNP